MLRATGLDAGTNGTRLVSVGMLWGAPRVESQELHSARLIANVPSNQLTFRSLSIPLAGRDVQERVVREELAYSLPFPIDEAVWDWVANNDTASVAIALNAQLNTLRGQVGENTTLDAEPLSYLRAAKYSGIDDALVIDFGASRTTLVAIKDGALDWVRVSFQGGSYLTKTLAKALEISEEQAEEHKKRLGVDELLCRDWVASIVASSLLTKPIPFDCVLICGGGAAMPGLVDELSTLLGQPTSLFPLPSNLDPLCHTSAFGAALAGKLRYPKIHLMPVTHQPERLEYAYLVWVLVVLALATVDVEVRYTSLAKHQAQEAQALSAAVTEQAPELAKMSPQELSTELKKRLAAAQKAKLRSPDNIGDTLAGLGRRLQTLKGVELRNISYLEDTNGVLVVTLEGQADSQQLVEEFRQAAASVLDQPQLIESRAGASNMALFTIEGKLRQQ